MTTSTQRRTRPTAKPAAPAQTEQAQQPTRPAVWLQVVMATGSTQPIGIAIDAPDWEMALDNAITQVKLIVMREQLAALKKA